MRYENSLHRLWGPCPSLVLSERVAEATGLPGHGPVTDGAGLNSLLTFFNDLEALVLGVEPEGPEAPDFTTIPVPAAYQNYRFQGLFPIALETAYQQLVLGLDDGASIQTYLQAQAPELKAL